MITSSEKIAALLPMKANSSRVPGKNFRSFHGKPLFRWILDSLLEIESIDKVIINTDARSILSQHGLNPSEKIIIRDRKKEICGDDISMNLVIQDDIDNISSETFLMTHTTNPLLSSSSIKRAIARFNQSKADSLLQLTKFNLDFTGQIVQLQITIRVFYSNPKSRTMVRRKFQSIYIFKKKLQ